MSVIAAFRDGWTALRSNPVILVAGFVYALGVPLGFYIDATASMPLSTVASVGWFLFTPFLLGGLIGMAVEAFDGPTSLGRFLDAGRTYYLRILAATLLFFLLVFALMIGNFVLGFVGMIAIAALGAISEWAVVVGFVALFLTFLAVLFLAIMFLQFFDAAIVVEDVGPIRGLRRSVAAVRRNVLSVLAYSVLWSVVLTLALLPEYLLRIGDVDGGPYTIPVIERTVDATAVISTVALVDSAVYVAVSVVVGGVAYAYLYTVHTAFYCAISSPEPADAQPPE